MNASVSCGFLAMSIDQNEGSYSSIRLVMAVKVKRSWAHAYSLENLYAIHKCGCFV